MDINFIFKGHSVIVKGINDRANGNRGIVFPADTKEATNSQGAAEWASLPVQWGFTCGAAGFFTSVLICHYPKCCVGFPQ